VTLGTVQGKERCLADRAPNGPTSCRRSPGRLYFRANSTAIGADRYHQLVATYSAGTSSLYWTGNW